MLEITPWWANTFHFKNLFFFIPPSPLANENVKCFFSYHYVKFCHNEFNCHYDIKNWNYFNGLKNWVISILQSSNGKEMPVEFFSLKNNFFCLFEDRVIYFTNVSILLSQSLLLCLSVAWYRETLGNTRYMCHSNPALTKGLSYPLLVQ